MAAPKEDDIPDENKYRILVAGKKQTGKKTLIDKFVELGADGKHRQTEDSKVVILKLNEQWIAVQIVCCTFIHLLFLSHFFLSLYFFSPRNTIPEEWTCSQSQPALFVTWLGSSSCLTFQAISRNYRL